MSKARNLAEQDFQLAQRVSTPANLMVANLRLGESLLSLGELTAAHEHFAQAWELYNPQQHNLRVISSWVDPGVAALANLAWTLWLLG